MIWSYEDDDDMIWSWWYDDDDHDADDDEDIMMKWWLKDDDIRVWCWLYNTSIVFTRSVQGGPCQKKHLQKVTRTGCSSLPPT